MIIPRIHTTPEVPESSSTMAFFKTVTVEEMTKLVTSMTNKSCELDPMPTSFVKVAVGALAPIITRIVNGYLMSGVFPFCYKEALVTPLLKKQSLDCNLLQNYHPVSNLTLISKTIEKVVSAQLNTYLKDNNLLEPCQSAYRQGHITETALVRVQNDVIMRSGSTEGGSTSVAGSVGSVRYGKSSASDQDTATARYSWYYVALVFNIPGKSLAED